MKPSSPRRVANITVLTVLLCIPSSYSPATRGAAESTQIVNPELCSAPSFQPDAYEQLRALAVEPQAVNVSTLDDIAVVLEYDSVYSVHTPIDNTKAANPAFPLASQPGSFLTDIILADLERKVDPTKYNFVLLYSPMEVPGWINSGAQGIPVPAKNIGLPNSFYGHSSSYPSWPRLFSAPHMNSLDFIDMKRDWYPGPGGTYSVLHEMGHYWNVYWSPHSQGPRLWKTTDPVAWLASSSSHWSYVWQPLEAAGIMYSAPLSAHFTEFDLYAMGLMGYSEARRVVHQVHQDPPSTIYDFKLDDLIYTLSLEGSSVYEGNGRRIPDTDPTVQNLNTLIVVLKGRDDVITDQQKSLLASLAVDIPAKWNIATNGRSSMNVGLFLRPQVTISSVDFDGTKSLTIRGGKFGSSPRVLINNNDRTRFVIGSSDSEIRLKGKAKKLGLKAGENTVQILDASGTGSNVFTVSV